MNTFFSLDILETSVIHVFHREEHQFDIIRVCINSLCVFLSEFFKLLQR